MPEQPVTLVRRINATFAPLGKVVTRTTGKDAAKGDYILLDIRTGKKSYISFDDVKRLAYELENGTTHC
jgi:hypothetical protein